MFTQSTTIAALLFATNLVNAHTYLITPKSRLSFKYNIGESLASGSGNGQGLCHLGDGTPVCCSSDKMSDSQMTTYKRGDDVTTGWWRNNHVGGFIRYSIVPIGDSNSQDAFDAAENVISYECNQVGCTKTYGGSSPNNWDGGDADGSSGWSNPCSGGFKIPYHLADGSYTMQWVWFGQGNGQSANSPFQACMDFKISGGDQGAQPTCPLWKGGDTSEKSANACSYVSVNSPTYQGVCKSANACSGSYQVGLPKPLSECLAGNNPSQHALGMVSQPDGAPDTFSNYSASGSAPASSSKSSSGSSSSASGSSGSSSGSSGSSSPSGGSSSSGSSSGSTSSMCRTKSGRLRRRSAKSLERRRHHARALAAQGKNH